MTKPAVERARIVVAKINPVAEVTVTVARIGVSQRGQGLVSFALESYG